jgi:hypothetical protein
MNLRDTFHQTVHGAIGGCEALAVRLGMSPQVLRNKANPNSSTNKPTLEEADRIMGLTGDHQLLHALAANHGFVCVPVAAEGTSDTAMIEIVAKIWSSSGEVGAELNKALADGRITRAELDRMRDVVRATERSLEELLGRLAGMAERA